jgi:trimethylamine--corrinoid protein Co-methyltransferase
MTNSIEQVVICDEIIAYTRHFLKEVDVDEDSLALDVIHEICVDGDFISSKHTALHYRKDWYPKLFERRSFEGWKKTGGKTLRQRAQEKALHILENHQPQLLPPDVQQKLDQIIEKAIS